MTSFYARTFFRFAFCLALWVLFSEASVARHIVGGEIYYECLGPGSSTNTRNYRLTMKIYRDCEGGGADFDNPAEIGIYSYIGGIYSFVRKIEVNHGSVKNLIASENPCLILPPYVCVE